MTWKIYMESAAFGRMTFDYDTEQDAREGLARLVQSCRVSARRDGIDRHLTLVADTESVIAEEEGYEAEGGAA